MLFDKLIFVFFLSLLFCFSGFSAQAAVDLSPRLAAELSQTIQKSGKVRVIVKVGSGFSPDGILSRSRSAIQKLNIASTQSRVVAQIAGPSAKVLARYKYIPFMALEVDANTLQKLTQLDQVVSIEEDVPVPPTMLSSNVVIGSNNAWTAGYTGEDWAVVVIDTGVDKTHSYFNSAGNNVVSEACYSSDYLDISYSVCPGGVAESTALNSGLDCNAAANAYPNARGSCSHGTHVAGIVAGNDGAGPDYGVAKNANIIAMQVFSIFPTYCDGSDCLLSWSSDQILALERVYELRNTFNIAAVNMSLGGGQYYSPCTESSLAAAIDNLRAVNIATITSSGNDSYTDSMIGPACVPSAISVGATDDFDEVAGFSNTANFIGLLAPGVSITSALAGGGTTTWQGTSMAAPHVAGAWAVLKQAYPEGTVSELLAGFQSTGTLVDDQRTGGSVTGMARIDLGHSDFFPPAGLDDLPSLGQFGIRLSAATGQAWLNGGNGPTYCPGYPQDAAYDSCLLTLPTLYDSGTKIGRSNTHPDDSSIDLTTGSAVCEIGTSSNCTSFFATPVKDSDFVLVPNTGTFTEGATDTREIHTQMVSLNLVDIFTSTANAVRAGSAASIQPRSVGEVESRNQAVTFFSAESFFDVFFEIDFDIDNDGALDMVLYNKPDDPLVMQHGDLTSFSSKAVYFHEGSERWPALYCKQDFLPYCLQDEAIGWLTIAVHGLSYSNLEQASFESLANAYDEPMLSGDGDGDGISDTLQNNVTTFSTTNSQQLTYRNGGGFSQNNVVSAVAPFSAKVDRYLLHGVASMTLTGLGSGATTIIELFLPKDESIIDYMILGNDGQWYELGASVIHLGNKTKIVFSVTEGGNFDTDGVADGILNLAQGGAIVRTGFEISPYTHSFGITALNTPTANQTFTITNKGSRSLTFGAALLSGAYDNQFNISADNCINKTVIAGANCSVDVNMRPTSVGSKSAWLEITTDDPDNATTAAFLNNYESTEQQARRRLPPVLYSLTGLPEVMTVGQSYNVTWELLGYHDDYFSTIVFFDCTGVASNCGSSYGSNFETSGVLSADSVSVGNWSYGGTQSKRSSFSYTFTPTVSQFPNPADIVIRFYRKNTDDSAAGKGSLSLIIPGNLSDIYYDTSGRRIQKRIQ